MMFVQTMRKTEELIGRGYCGEQNGRFYDRIGDYFRKGVDPRNYFGRFVEHEYKDAK